MDPSKPELKEEDKVFISDNINPFINPFTNPIIPRDRFSFEMNSYQSFNDLSNNAEQETIQVSDQLQVDTNFAVSPTNRTSKRINNIILFPSYHW